MTWIASPTDPDFVPLPVEELSKLQAIADPMLLFEAPDELAALKFMRRWRLAQLARGIVGQQQLMNDLFDSDV